MAFDNESTTHRDYWAPPYAMSPPKMMIEKSNVVHPRPCVGLWIDFRFAHCVQYHWFIYIFFSGPTSSGISHGSRTHIPNGLSWDGNEYWHRRTDTKKIHETIKPLVCSDHTANILNNVIFNTHNGKWRTQSFRRCVIFFFFITRATHCHPFPVALDFFIFSLCLLNVLYTSISFIGNGKKGTSNRQKKKNGIECVCACSCSLNQCASCGFCWLIRMPFSF